MEPKSGRKPINVLTEYLTSWIRANSEEALPFDSFENLKPGRVAQKNVERWVFNCNYVYNRMGGIFYDRNIFPQYPGECAKLIRSLDRAFKSISDNTPLDLRSKPSESVPYELSKDWPPFTENSRNTLERFESSLGRFRNENPTFCERHANALTSAEAELRKEASYYALVNEEAGDGSRALVTRCRTLLPIWCAKEINPLVTLLIWSDEDALASLVDELASSFSAQRDFDASHVRTIETWHDATLQAQALYIDNLDDDATLTTLSVPDRQPSCKRGLLTRPRQLDRDAPTLAPRQSAPHLEHHHLHGARPRRSHRQRDTRPLFDNGGHLRCASLVLPRQPHRRGAA